MIDLQGRGVRKKRRGRMIERTTIKSNERKESMEGNGRNVKKRGSTRAEKEGTWKIGEREKDKR